jgi:pimeloyl-ACP methyl ester carboxylesterase
MKSKKRHFLIGIGLLVLIAGALIVINSNLIRSTYNQALKIAGSKDQLFKIRFLSNVNSTKISFQSDALTIVGDLITPTDPNGAAILLLHGSSPAGRKLPLMLVLAHQFSKMGYTVLNIDLRGYGESQKPSKLSSAMDFNFKEDVKQAIKYLSLNGKLASTKLFVFGHSFGAGAAIASIMEGGGISKMVLFGPPRRFTERVLMENARDREYFLKRWKEDMKLDFNLNYNIWKDVIQQINIGRDFPVLLIDAELESKEDKSFLSSFVKTSSNPIPYWTIIRTNHYLNTGLIQNRVAYNKKIIDGFITQVSNWLLNNGPIN